MKLIPIFTALILSTGLCYPQSVDGQKFTITFEKTLHYLLDLPEGYDKDDTEKWPLLLFLHGAGERGEDLQKVRVHGPPKQAAAGKKLPFILVSPQCPAGGWWQPELLMALIENIEANHRVDPDRIYVTGLSMGGYGTLDLATTYPDKFAAIAPVCGGGIPYKTRFITELPIWTFHGDADTAVPISETQVLVDELKKRNSPVKFTIYPEVGHNSWDSAYSEPDLYPWLLKQKRVKKEPVQDQ